MKKVGVLSDSHHHLEDLEKAIEYMGDVDLIIHLGDMAEDGEYIKTLTSIPVLNVKGNCDFFDDSTPEFLKTKVEDVTIFAAHGHNENVKYSPMRFINKVHKNNAQLGLFGHSHRKFYEENKGAIVINPGSCSLPSDGSKSFAIVDIDGRKVDCNFFEFD